VVLLAIPEKPPNLHWKCGRCGAAKLRQIFLCYPYPFCYASLKKTSPQEIVILPGFEPLCSFLSFQRSFISNRR